MSYRLFLIFILSVITPMCLAEALPAKQSFSKQSFSNNYIDGMVRGDAAHFSSAFADNIKIMPEYDKTYIGGQNAARYFAAIFKQYDIHALERSTVEVLTIGKRSVEIGTFQLRFTPKGKKQTISLPGTYLETWDTSSAEAKLVTMAWNYDSHQDGMHNIFRAETPAGVHYAFEPTAPIDSPISYEVAANHNFVTTLMLRKHPEILAIRFADDGWFAPHGLPLQKGKAAMTKHLIDYAKNWPAFDYVDVNAHEIYAHGDYTIEHISYNLRWRKLDASGIAIGKSIRIAKRNAEGILQMYRSIPMHD